MTVNYILIIVLAIMLIVASIHTYICFLDLKKENKSLRELNNDLLATVNQHKLEAKRKKGKDKEQST